MYKLIAIAKTTAHEILSEPLSLLVTLSALALTVLSPVLHYHQFGEATRMARDAMFSAMLIGGVVIAVFSTIKTYRRELEDGTADMALSHSISRGSFFISKLIGIFVALSCAMLSILGAGMLMVFGSALGEAISFRTGNLTTVFGPCVAGGAAIILLPIILSAILNRFARFRFVITCQLTALALALLAIAVSLFAYPRLFDYLPAALLLVSLLFVFATIAAAFSMHMKSNLAASLSFIMIAIFLPAIGNYYLSEALSHDGSISWLYVLFAFLAIAPVYAIFMLIGVQDRKYHIPRH